MSKREEAVKKSDVLSNPADVIEAIGQNMSGFAILDVLDALKEAPSATRHEVVPFPYGGYSSENTRPYGWN